MSHLEEFICNIKGEEPPHIAKLCISKKHNVPVEEILFQSTQIPSEFKITIGNKYYKYILSKPGCNKTRGDIYFDGDNKILVEFTACCLSSSGNNAQFQRFTKFIPFLKEENIELCYYVYNKEDKIQTLERQNKIAFKMWKTNGINVFFEKNTLQTDFNNLEIYSDIDNFIIEWNKNARVPKIKKEDNYCILENFNVEKSGSITNDPGIGKTLLTIMTLVVLGEKQIKLVNTGINCEGHFGVRNKFFRSINNIIKNFNIEIIFDYDFINNKIEKCELYNSEIVFGCKADYESVVSINYEIKLDTKINYTNHASCEQSLLCFKDITDNVPKKVLKTDIIYSIDNNTYFVEAEKYVNLENGRKQIVSWAQDINTYQYYKKTFTGQNIKCYLILYDKDNLDINLEETKFKNVKCILQENGNWLMNDTFEYLEFTNSILLTN